jgi:hypothetical protein
MAEDGLHSACGLCGTETQRENLARGRKRSICRRCVEAGLVATLHSTAEVRVGESVPRAYANCSVCGEATPPESSFRSVGGEALLACATCLDEAYAALTQMLEMTQRRHAFYPSGSSGTVAGLLERHFGERDPSAVVTASRVFPAYLRADLQRALDGLWSDADVQCVGIHSRYSFNTVTYASLLEAGHDPVQIAPLQYEDVDVGDGEPVPCLRNALWLATGPELPHVVLFCNAHDHGQQRGWQVEVCVPAGEQGARLTREYFRVLETAVKQSAAYRGKVLSLECEDPHRGTSTGTLLVHRLAPVSREDIILPARTIALLERNVFDFVRQRDRLRALGMPVKKGLLFYGPPGTGKTHTIRWLAGALPGHTTLIITAEQVLLIRQYMAIARLLSPAIVVIEDVDLIARQRGTLETPQQESLLNQLLNEMDGLRENTDVLFVLTTNHPEALEAALAGRPGRIDQSVEFPLPDDDGRRRLVELYRRGLAVGTEVKEDIVARTKGVSASFIKELMRRTAQFVLERDAEAAATELADIDHALVELLFEGGSLNAKLLGAASDPSQATVDP